MNLLTISIIVNIVVLIICVFIVSRNIKHMRNTMNDYASLMYETMKRTDEASKTSLNIENGINTVDDNVKSLTSSIRSLVKQQQEQQKSRNNEKIFPGPQLLEMLDKCIVENVSMMATLIHKQRVPDDPLTRVTDITIQTFPHINEQYIIDRCIYVMEEFNKSQSGQKSR